MMPEVLRTSASRKHRRLRSKSTSNFAGADEADDNGSDLSTAMSSMNLQQANSSSLQQQRQADAQNPQYGQDAHADEPLAAPTPTRASVGPQVSVWNPEVGIRFGTGGIPTTSGHARPANGPPQDGRWDPAQGLKFG